MRATMVATAVAAGQTIIYGLEHRIQTIEGSRVWIERIEGGEITAGEAAQLRLGF